MQDLEVERKSLEVSAVPEIGAQPVASFADTRAKTNFTDGPRIELCSVEYAQDRITGPDHLLVGFADLSDYLFERCNTGRSIPNSARFLNRGAEWLFPGV